MAKPEPTGAPRAGAFTLVIGILELQRYQFPLLKLRGMCFVKETWNTEAAVKEAKARLCTKPSKVSGASALGMVRKNNSLEQAHTPGQVHTDCQQFPGSGVRHKARTQEDDDTKLRSQGTILSSSIVTSSVALPRVRTMKAEVVS